jgi:hypothetical protein
MPRCQTRKSLRSAAVLLAFLGIACGQASIQSSAAQTTPGQAQGVTVSVNPGAVTLKPGDNQVFAAAVTGTANTAVTWSLQEGAPAGAITSGGAYTAPATAGTYHVIATSAADPTQQGSAVVTVSATPVVSIAIAPAAISLSAGAQTTFQATVTGNANTAATWSVVEASGCGSVTSAGVYTAPSASATCHVRATSQADTTKTATATVTVTAVTPISVAVTPTTGALNGCQTLTLSASVTGSTNQAVTWSVLEAGGGTVTSAGVYTAPDATGTFHVVGTSVADASKSASAAITVSTKVLSVAVSPTTITVPASGTAQFAATVTTTCGSVVALQTVSANGLTN